VGVGEIRPGAVAMVRPDDVTFEVDAAGDASIVDAEFRGSTWCYTLRLGSGALVRSTRNHLLRASIGTRVRASINPGHRPVLIADES
jgi:iron(III) transport system ATP-binding protein